MVGCEINMTTIERTPEEKLQLELQQAKSRIRQLENLNEQLRKKLSWVAGYGEPLPLDEE